MADIENEHILADNYFNVRLYWLRCKCYNPDGFGM